MANVIRTFADKSTQDLFITGRSRRLPPRVVQRARRKLRHAMTIENTDRREVRPIHPGEMLREDFLPEYGLTVSGLARALDVSRQTINELLRERRAVSPDMALRLSRLFGNSPEFWLDAQRAVDLWDAARAIRTKLARIRPLPVA